MNSKTIYTFLAQTPKGLENTCLKELSTSFGIEGKLLKNLGINEICFKSNQDTMHNLIYKCRTIDNLKVQISSSFRARGDKELMKGLRKLPWKAYLSLNTISTNNIPKIKCKSYSSKLFHERKVEDMIMSFLQKFVYKIGLKNSTAATTASVDSKNDEIEEQQPKKEIQQENNLNSSDLASKSQHKIMAYISHDKARVALNLIGDSLHKHGMKNIMGWGSIKESIVAACLIETDFISRKREKKQLKLWDPFCGSGTILLESISMFMDWPIRSNLEDMFLFKDMPTFDKELFDTYKCNLDKKNKFEIPNDVTIEIYGSDISEKEIIKCEKNFELAEIDRIKKSINAEEFNRGANNPLVYQKKVGEISILFNTDFEVASKHIPDLKDLNIITNIPYGLRSSKYISNQQLKSTFKRFSKFLNSHQQILGEVYVICPSDSNEDKEGFIRSSQLQWEKNNVFDNQGISVGLFKLVR